MHCAAVALRHTDRRDTFLDTGEATDAFVGLGRFVVEVGLPVTTKLANSSSSY